MARSKVKGTKGKPVKKATGRKPTKIASQHVTTKDHYKSSNGSSVDYNRTTTVKQQNDGRPIYTHHHTDKRGNVTKTKISDDEKSKRPIPDAPVSWSKMKGTGAFRNRTYYGSDAIKESLKIRDSKKAKSKKVTESHKKKKYPKRNFIQ